MRSQCNRPTRLVLVSFAVALASGCAGRYHAAEGARQAVPTPAVIEEGGLPPGGFEAAALPMAVLDARTGRELTAAAAWDVFAAARVVCVGEQHPSAHHHWAQREVVRALIARWPRAAVGLGLEMVQRPMQGVLTDYASGTIDATTFVLRAGWADRWGYDFAMYQPMLDEVRAVGGALLALNTERELTRAISRRGRAQLTAEERARLPEADFAYAPHRAWFMALMAEMPAHGHGASAPAGATSAPPLEQIYDAQVVWDETMAEGAAAWLAGDGARRLVILAGTGHCQDHGIEARLRRRGVAEVLSVTPVTETGDGEVAAALVAPISDFLLVLRAKP